MLKQIFKEKLTKFGSIFLLTGILLQIITFIVTKDSWLSLTCGVAGVFAVVTCSEKKISMYAFSLVQLFTYVALCFQQNLYGEIAENIFYFITMMIGIVLWKRNYNEDKKEIETKSIPKNKWFSIILGIVIISVIVGKLLSFTNDTQPYMDAFSTIPAFIGQIFLMLRYREQWYLWLIVDVLTGILWIQAGNWCMVSQYAFWIANCIYGLKSWK